MKNTQEELPLEHQEYSVTYKGYGLKLWGIILISIIAAMVSILSTDSLNDTRTSTVFFVFISVLIVEFAIYYLGAAGILVATFSSFLFCITIKTSVYGVLLNIGANTAQAVVIWAVLKFTKTDEKIASQNGLITNYKFILIILGILYIVASFLFKRSIVFYVFAGATLLLSAIYSIIERSPNKIFYYLLLCVLPSVVGGSINSINTFVGSQFSLKEWFDNFSIWIFSNIVLFATFGYLLLSILGRFQKQSSQWQSAKISFKRRDPKTIKIKLTTILYYISTLCWNILFYIMYIQGWLNNNTPLFLFPWTVGNIFFIVNMMCSMQPEVENISRDEAFKHFENRAIVAEKNTQMLIAVIAFLLPLCANFLGKVTPSILFVFVLNITTAIVSIGLIWVPRNNIRFMELIKNLKTIFHLFTLSLLLLNAVMIITNGI